MKKIQSINPFTEEVVEEFDLLSLDDCKSEVENSRKALCEWKSRSVSDR